MRQAPVCYPAHRGQSVGCNMTAARPQNSLCSCSSYREAGAQSSVQSEFITVNAGQNPERVCMEMS